MKINDKRDFIIFSKSFSKGWRIELVLILRKYNNKYVNIDCKDWSLNCKEINELRNICKRKNIEINLLQSTNKLTIISANSIGINTLLKDENDSDNASDNIENTLQKNKGLDGLFFHQGTLRSGETLDVDNDLLIIGDVNPGATVSAGGNIMIWGRLRGVAHAGKYGNIQSKITALQLRPVQLRIATKIARGPDEKPEEGLAEEATIEENMIVIKPARTY